jgi:NitT/TauT family transport system substrate-binding protein
MSGGFLKEEGLDPEYSVAPAGLSAITALEEGKADVIQSALSQAFGPLSRGKTPSAVHFAQVNEMDGFFITARDEDPNFSWDKLEGSDVILFGGGQPLAMFKYACFKAGINYDRINAIHPGGAAEIDYAFRSGKGQYVQQQGPFPQQLEADKIGSVVARVGPMIGPCGFSSLAAKPEWLESAVATRFMRAYKKTRAYMLTTPAKDIAAAEKPYFPNIEAPVLESCIKIYQSLGCWTPHTNITREAYEATLDIFEYNQLISERFPYESVCGTTKSI